MPPSADTVSGSVDAGDILFALCLRTQSTAAAVRAGVTADAFARPEHRRAWAWLLERAGERMPPLATFKRAHPEVRTVLPPDIAADLQDAVSADWEGAIADYATTLVHAAAQAKLRLTLQEALRSLDGGADPYKLAASVQAKTGTVHKPITSAATEFSTVGQEILESYSRKAAGLRGIPTPYPYLNDIIGGLMEEKFYVATGLTSSGKSWLLLSMAYRAWVGGARVLLCLGEMGRLQTLDRLAALHTGLPAKDIAKARLTPEQEVEFTRSLQALLPFADTLAPFKKTGRAGLWIRGNSDTPGSGPLSAAQVQADVEKHHIDLVVYDSAYKAVASLEAKDQNNLSSQFLAIARRNRIPVVVSVQLNDAGATYGARMWEKDADVAFACAVGPNQETGRSILGVEISKDRDGDAVGRCVGIDFDPGRMVEIGPTNMAAIRAHRKALEEDRGRYGAAGSGRDKRETAAPGAAPKAGGPPTKFYG